MATTIRVILNVIWTPLHVLLSVDIVMPSHVWNECVQWRACAFQHATLSTYIIRKWMEALNAYIFEYGVERVNIQIKGFLFIFISKRQNGFFYILFQNTLTHNTLKKYTKAKGRHLCKIEELLFVV